MTFHVTKILTGHFHHIENSAPMPLPNSIHPNPKNTHGKYVEYDYEHVNNKKFYEQYYSILENSENSFTSTTSALGELITSTITILGVAYLVFCYNYMIMLIILGLVVLSFICSMKSEKKQYLFKEFTTVLKRKVDYIRRIFYMPDYFKD